MASAWFAGTGPALAATVAGGPRRRMGRTLVAENVRATQTHLALFVVQGLLLTALVSELRARAPRCGARGEAQEARRESERPAG